MMPVADFAGQFGWGYDGVNLYAPTRLYGTPDDLRAFVDRAHALGLGVILDVVYNHLGPDGNYLADFSPDYFTDRYKNDWGRAINFEGPPRGARVLRRERGLLDRRVSLRWPSARRDAGHPRRVAGSRPRAIIARRARGGGRQARPTSSPRTSRRTRAWCAIAARRLRPRRALERRLSPHAAVVALTGRREAYYTDYKGSVQEFISCAKYGYLYQGQWYRGRRSGAARPASICRRTLRRLPREPRSGRELGVRAPAPPDVVAGRVTARSRR